MAADWIGIDSSHLMAGGAGVAFCNDESTGRIVDALSGNDYWVCYINHVHYVILDLGVSYNVQKVRGYSALTGDPLDVDVFVSNDTGDWGAAVASGINTWADCADWVEVDTTDEEGRYVKVVINDTENFNRVLAFGTAFPSSLIFDVYGEVAAGEDEDVAVFMGANF